MIVEYYITQHSRTHFEVAKFGDRNAPEDVYDIVSGHCNCPSPKSPCKHVLMLRRWLKLDHPEDFYFDITTDAFVKHRFTGDIMKQVTHFLKAGANNNG